MSLIHEQIPKIMGSVCAIGKDRKNVQQGYNFRGIDDVYNALNATMAERFVFRVKPGVSDDAREPHRHTRQLDLRSRAHLVHELAGGFVAGGFTVYLRARGLAPVCASVGVEMADFQSAAADVQYLTKLINSLQIPSELKIRFEWSPDLHNWNDICIATNQWTNTPASLVIGVELLAKTNLNPEPQFSAICSLQNFTLDLIGNFTSFLKLHFERVEFTASSSKKPDINVVISEI